MLQDLIVIIILQLVYVPIYTLGMLLMVKGYTHISSFLSIFEVLIYVYGLSIVIQGDQSFVLMLVYAISNAVGMELGAYIEGKLAFGYLSVEIYINEKDNKLMNALKKKGFKATIYEEKDAREKEKTRYCIEVLTDRKREDEIADLVLELQPDASLVMYEPYDIRGRNPITKRKRMMPSIFARFK